MTQQEIQKNITRIEAIFAEFQKQIHRLKSEQDLIITTFLKNLENAKLDELRKTIAGG